MSSPLSLNMLRHGNTSGSDCFLAKDLPTNINQYLVVCLGQILPPLVLQRRGLARLRLTD